MRHFMMDDGLHCLLRRNQTSEKEIQYFLKKNITCDPSIYTMDHPDLIVIGLIRVKILNGLNISLSERSRLML